MAKSEAREGTDEEAQEEFLNILKKNLKKGSEAVVSPKDRGHSLNI